MGRTGDQSGANTRHSALSEADRETDERSWAAPLSEIDDIVCSSVDRFRKTVIQSTRVVRVSSQRTMSATKGERVVSTGWMT